MDDIIFLESDRLKRVLHEKGLEIYEKDPDGLNFPPIGKQSEADILYYGKSYSLIPSKVYSPKTKLALVFEHELNFWAISSGLIRQNRRLLLPFETLVMLQQEGTNYVMALGVQPSINERPPYVVVDANNAVELFKSHLEIISEEESKTAENLTRAKFFKGFSYN